METKTSIKVRGYHLDIYKHVNNARYLEFLEEARWDYLDKSGAMEYFAKQKLAFVIININISYKFPAFNGDVLTITTTPFERGNTSIKFQQSISNQNGKLVSEAIVTFGMVDLETNQITRVSDDVYAAFSGTK